MAEEECVDCCSDGLSVPVGPPGADGRGYYASSESSNTIGTGSKTFTTQENLAYSPGARTRFWFDASNYMEGQITSYSGTTLIANIDYTVGSGTHSSWTINVAGESSPSFVNGPGSSTDNAVVRFDGTTGKILQNSGLLLDDNSNLLFPKEVNHTISIATSTTLTTTIGASLTISAGQGSTDANGGDITISSGNAGGGNRNAGTTQMLGGTASGSFTGGRVWLTGGTGGATGIGGEISLLTGVANANFNSGQLLLKSNNATGTGQSGLINLSTGTTVSGNSGTLTISTGIVSTSGNSGDLTITTGNSNTSGDTGNIIIRTGASNVSGNSGKIVIDTSNGATSTGIIILNKSYVNNHNLASINATATATAEQLSTGYIVSTSAAPTNITLPTASSLSSRLGVTQGGCFFFYVDNSGGVSTVTIVVNTGITVCGGVITGSTTLTVLSGAIGIFKLVFSGGTSAILYRMG